MTETARAAVDAGAPRLWPGLAFVVGAGLLVLLLLHPGFDESWENHPAHFWLVLTAASLSVGLGYAVGGRLGAAAMPASSWSRSPSSWPRPSSGSTRSPRRECC